MRQLLEMGAPTPQPTEPVEQYLSRALREGGFRRLPHPGNYVYAWWLGDRRMAPESFSVRRPYPPRVEQLELKEAA
jgi:hypothetical protein